MSGNPPPIPDAADINPLVSIVIPVFNGARWLGEAIDSALAQTHLNTEVIVIDDGSNDAGRTRAVVEAYGDQIRSISKSNGGVASALNAGIAAMRGDFFSWLSHDDLYLPRKIETQLAVARRFPEPVVVFGDVSIIDEDGRKACDVLFSAQCSHHDHAMWHVLGGRLSGCSLLIPRICFDLCGTFDERLPTTQDYELWFRLAQRFRFEPASGVLTQSRAHSEQGSRDPRHMVEASLSWMAFINDLPHDARTAMAANEFALAHRISKLPAMQTYPGLSAFARRLIAAARARANVTLVIDLHSSANILSAHQALESIGYPSVDTILTIRESEQLSDSPPVLHPVLRAAHRIALGCDANVGDIAAAVAERADPDGLVVFWSQEKLRDGEALKNSFERLLSGEIDAIFDPDAADNGFSGMCVRTQILRAALRRAAPSNAKALLQEIVFLGQVSLTSTDAGLGPEPQETASSDNHAFEAVDPIRTVAVSEAQSAEPLAPVIADRADAVSSHTHVSPAPRQELLPYLGRYEILRLLRRPLLNERKMERALQRTERLQHFLGGMLYGPRLWYLQRLLGVQGKIDRVWYWRTYPDIPRETDPVLHYLRHGWREGRDPSVHFSTRAYLESAPGSVEINPLSHATFYAQGDSSELQLGSFLATRTLRRPLTNPRIADGILRTAVRLHRTLGPRLSRVPVRFIEWLFGASGKIDREWYAQTQLGIEERDADPSLHYLLTGWRQGASPSRRALEEELADAPSALCHLNPLSQRAFLGPQHRFAPPGRSLTTAHTQDQPTDFEEHVAGASDSPPIQQAASESNASGTDSTGSSRAAASVDRSEAVRKSNAQAVELLIVSDGSRIAEEWIRHIGRSITPRVNFFVARPTPEGLTLSDQSRIFDTAEDRRIAGFHVLESGVKRIDCVGTPQSATMEAFVEFLDLPLDVTILSQRDIKRHDLLKRAQRLIVADAELMNALSHISPRADAKLVSLPGECARFAFKVWKRRPRRDEGFRVLAVSDLAPDSVAAQIKSVGKVIDENRLPMTIHAAQDCVGISQIQSIRWLGPHSADDLVCAIGETDPHLLWFLSDPDDLFDPLLQEVAGMGLPVVVTGSALVARRLYGRPCSWSLGDASAEEIAEQLEKLRRNDMDLPTAGLLSHGMRAAAFYPEEYLDWRADDR